MEVLPVTFLPNHEGAGASTVKPRLSGLIGTSVNSPDNRGPDNRGPTVKSK